MTSVEDDVREFFATAPLDVAASSVSVATVVESARRRRRRCAMVSAGAVSAMVSAAAMIVASVVWPGPRAGDSLAVAGTDLPGIADVSHLDVITPTDVGGLAIGMTLDEVRDSTDAEVITLHPAESCVARIEIGDTVRGFAEPWPADDGDVVITALTYYGSDARTIGGAAVGRRIEDEDAYAQTSTPVDTPLGMGTTVLQGDPFSGIGPTGVGYHVFPSCIDPGAVRPGGGGP